MIPMRFFLFRVISKVMSHHQLLNLLGNGHVVVLSGAGISTESGIPDYRGPSGSLQRNHQPMTYQTFLRDPFGRKRYWARSHLGWEYMSQVQPNAGHKAVADLEQAGFITGVITQNVDGLHQAAGSANVIDLHGRLDRVSCLGCGTTWPRSHIQQRLAHANTDWTAHSTTFNPDGDAELSETEVHSFNEVSCELCEGIIKPDVVYFGENVPSARVEQSYDMVNSAKCLLVLGSTLTVFSGRRFALHAQKNSIPIAIINDGPTRADDIAQVKLESSLGSTLTSIVNSLHGNYSYT